MEKDEIYRRMDKVGRICIPRDARILLGIRAGDMVRITVSKGAITLRPHTACCARCRAKKALVEVTRGVYLCRNCVEDLATEKA